MPFLVYPPRPPAGPTDPPLIDPTPVPPVVSVPWRYVVTDTAGVAIGEPLATGRQFTAGVSTTATAQFRVKSGTSLWSSIAAGDTMLKIYDSTHALQYYGEIVTDELSATGQGGSAAFTSSDLSWRLSKRLTGKDFDGVGTEHLDKDSGEIIFDVLDEINAEQETGILPGNKDVFVNRTMTLLWKPVLQLLAELGAIESSYEWTLRYVDGTPPQVYLDLKTRVGDDVSGLVFFEYGTGKNNCQGYTRTRSMETSATRVYGLGAGSTVVAVGYDASAETARRLEDQISFSDISTPSLVDALVAAHVAFRARPRKVVTFTPAPKLAPVYGADWSFGDFVTARAVVDGVW